MSSLRTLQQPPPYADYLHLAVRAKTQCLEARWLRLVSSAEYRAGNEALLAAAEAAACPFWLVDVRRRTSPSEADGRWLMHEYLPQVPRRLGSSVFVGTLLPPGYVMPASPEHPTVPDALQPVPYLILRNFSNEPALTEWLRRCQLGR